MHVPRECSLAGSNCPGCIVQGESVLQSRAGPIFETLHNRIRMDEVIGQRIGGLRWPRVDDEVFRRQRSELWADSADDPQRKVHMAQRSSRSHETSGLYNHVRFGKQ